MNHVILVEVVQHTTVARNAIESCTAAPSPSPLRLSDSVAGRSEADVARKLAVTGDFPLSESRRARQHPLTKGGCIIEGQILPLVQNAARDINEHPLLL